MKKLLRWFLCILMMLSLIACGNQNVKEEQIKENVTVEAEKNTKSQEEQIRESAKAKLEEDLAKIQKDFAVASNPYIFDVDSYGLEFLNELTDFQGYNSYMRIAIGSGHKDKSYVPYAIEDLCELYTVAYEEILEKYEKAQDDLNSDAKVKILAKNYMEKSSIIYNGIKNNEVTENCDGPCYKAADELSNIYSDFLDAARK